MWNWIKSMFGKKSEIGQAPVSQSLPSASMRPSTQESCTKHYPERRLETPNKQSDKCKPEAIILHHTDGRYEGSVDWCTQSKSQVSYHCIIARDGRRTVLADDTDRTWHAGVSEWKGRGDANSWSIGISWEGDTYTTPLDDDAMESAIEYLVPRMKKWNIPMSMVLTHAQVSPRRKNDISQADADRFKSRLKAALQN